MLAERRLGDIMGGAAEGPSGPLPCPCQLYLPLPKNFLPKGAQMARPPQPPWWWRSEVLARMAIGLSAAVTVAYLMRLLM